MITEGTEEIKAFHKHCDECEQCNTMRKLWSCSFSSVLCVEGYALYLKAADSTSLQRKYLPDGGMVSYIPGSGIAPKD